MYWNEKVIIITGSGHGIGLATALEAGSQGARIVLNCRNSDRLEKALRYLHEKGINAIACQGDISDPETCSSIAAQAYTHYGRIDLLINNAAINAVASFEEMLPEVFRTVIGINLLGSANMASAVLPYLREHRGGILFTGSLMGIHGMGNYSAYSCSKMALRALTESLRIELEDSGIYIGLAYVACTDNSPDKTFLNKHGECIPEPPRRRINSQPVDRVAHTLLEMARKRQYLRYFTLLGKVNAIVNCFFPGIIHRVFLKTYISDRRIQAATAEREARL